MLTSVRYAWGFRWPRACAASGTGARSNIAQPGGATSAPQRMVWPALCPWSQLPWTLLRRSVPRVWAGSVQSLCFFNSALGPGCSVPCVWVSVAVQPPLGRERSSHEETALIAQQEQGCQVVTVAQQWGNGAEQPGSTSGDWGGTQRCGLWSGAPLRAGRGSRGLLLSPARAPGPGTCCFSFRAHQWVACIGSLRRGTWSAEPGPRSKQSQDSPMDRERLSTWG